jgi:ABC-2 type transport system ATP-binding protein
MIILKNLTKTYRGIRAVDNLNLHIPKGTIFGFIGPNGAGKTTTIRMMTGVLRPTSGSIYMNGSDIAREPSEVKRIIGYIPDRPFLYEKLSGAEFMRFKAGLYGIGGERLKEEVQQLMQLFELSEWADELIESSSQGM